MALLLFALFILIPIAELYVIVEIAGAIGIWWTLALLITSAVAGAYLLRHQGRAAWRSFRSALSAGRVPAREVLDGALVILGGALLLTPGFLTDIAGIALLIPPTRDLVTALATRLLARRSAGLGWIVGAASTAGGRATPRRSGPRPGDIEGTAEEVDGTDPVLPGTRDGTAAGDP